MYTVVGFDENSIVEFLKYLRSPENEETDRYPKDYITFRDNYCEYYKIDNVFEIWRKHFDDDEENDRKVYFSFYSGAFDKIENLEEDTSFEPNFYRIFKFNVNGIDSPLFAEIPAPCIPKPSKDGKYNMSIAGEAYQLLFFKTEDEFRRATGENDVESVESIVEYGDDSAEPVAILYISGYVKSLQKLTNSFTGVDYYKLIISSESHDYIVFAENENIPDNVAVNDIVCGTLRFFGSFEVQSPKGHFLTWKFSDGKERFNDELSPILFGLNPILFDFLVVDFPKDDMIDDIEFIQTKISSDNDLFYVEVKKVKEGIKYLYRYSNIELHEIMKILYDLCVNKMAPDVSSWEDISDEIFDNRRVDGK